MILPGLFLLAAVLLSFFYLFLPASLWLVDRLFSKALGQKLMTPAWNLYGIGGAALSWVLWWLTR